MSPDTSSDEPLAERIAEEILARRRRGEKPSVDEYCRKYPDQAEELRSFLPTLLAVENLKPDSEDESGTFGSDVKLDGQRLEQVGDYRILREIGRGGMGVVYEAEQQALSRRVALKVLPRQMAGDAKAVERFGREARAAARMHHTNIVPVFDVGQDDEHLFYAMQLIQGQGLDQVIDDLKQLRKKSSAGGGKSTAGRAESPSDAVPPHSIAQSLMSGRFEQEELGSGADSGASSSSNSSELATEKQEGAVAVTETVQYRSDSTGSAVLPGQSDISTARSNRHAYHGSVAQIGLQTASALAYAHARGIIHRDIKPSNLLLDAAGVVWITDFGLAKTGDQGMTHTGDILGTIRYMSPERFRGQCDVRADLYSLGLCLYELLLLKPAFVSADQLHLIDKINKTEPDSPRTIDARIPRDLETIVLKSVDKDPKRRYQSADEMADDLQRFINDEPIQARRISLPEQFFRWSRRNKGLATSLSAVVMLLALLAIGSMISAGYFHNINQTLNTALGEVETKAHENERLAGEKEIEAQRAITAKNESDRLRREADSLAAEQLIRRAGHERARGDVALAALLDTEALRRDSTDPQRAANHRRRVAADLRQCPRPTHVLFHDAEVRDARYSDNGRWIVTAAADGFVRVWDVTTGDCIRTLRHDGETTQVMFQRDDSRLLTFVVKTDLEEGELSGEIHLWDWQNDESLAVVPNDGKQTFSTNREIETSFLNTPTRNQLLQWSTETGERIEPTLELDQPIKRYLGAGNGRWVLFKLEQVDESRQSARVIAPLSTRVSIGLWDRRTGTKRLLAEDVETNTRSILSAMRYAISSDGTLIALNYNHRSNNERLGIYRTDTGEQLESFSVSNDDTAPIAFSSDGRRLLCMTGVSSSSTIRGEAYELVDVATGKRIGLPMPADNRLFVFSFDPQMSPDGLRILTRNAAGYPQIWSSLDGSANLSPVLQSANAQSCTFSPDGRFIGVITADGDVRVWDSLSGAAAGPNLEHGGAVTKATFSPDGSRVLTASGDRVWLWPIDGPRIRQVEIADQDRVTNSAQDRGLVAPGLKMSVISPSGRRVATLEPSFTRETTTVRNRTRISIWDSTTGEPTHGPKLLENHLKYRMPGLTSKLSFSADENHLLYVVPGLSRLAVARGLRGQSEPECHLWNLLTDQLTSLPIPKNATGLEAEFSLKGDSLRMTFLLRNEHDGAGGESPLERLAVSRSAASRLWDVRSGQPRGPAVEHPFVEPGLGLRGLMRSERFPTATLAAWSPDGTRMAAMKEAESGSRVNLWDMQTGEQIGAPLGFEHDVRQLEFSQSGNTLLIVTAKGDRVAAHLFDAATGRKTAGPFRSDQGGEKGRVLIGPEGRHLVLLAGYTTPFLRRRIDTSPHVEIRVVETGERTPLRHELAVISAKFSSDGRLLLTASADGVARLWDAARGELIRSFRHTSLLTVFDAFLSGDDQRVITRSVLLAGTENGPSLSLQVWDTATGQPIASWTVEGERRRMSAFSVLNPFKQWSSRAERFLLPHADRTVVCDLSAEDRSSEDLLRLTRVLSGRRINDRGNILLLSSQEYRDAWQSSQHDLRKRLLPPVTGVDWHRQQYAELNSQTPHAIQQYQSGRAEIAAWHLEKLIAAEPDNPQHYDRRAEYWLGKGEYERVLEDTARVLELTAAASSDDSTPPASASLITAARSNRADVLAQLDRWNETVAELEALRVHQEAKLPDGNLDPILTKLALARYRAGDSAGYEAACEDLLESNPSSGISSVPDWRHLLIVPRSVEHCERIAERLAARRLNSPRTLSETNGRSIPESPSGPIDSRMRAWLAFRSHRHEEVIRLWEKESADLEDPADLFVLAISHYHAGTVEAAQAFFSRGVEAMAVEQSDAAPRFGSPAAEQSLPRPWPDRVIDEALHREADKLINGAENEASP